MLLRGTTKRERSGTVSGSNLTRPFSSETDIPAQFDVDHFVNRMNDFELNKKFEEMLVSFSSQTCAVKLKLLEIG